ncbi:ester cyclase [Curtobacterium sp. Leaf261]|uniref:ester cyclase n=1 Tax=Curtobacterium sp. Leaf261 TaxID=1736311 RepID=UPI0006F2E334|nr:ester cyclase [Curtobacterium sp. Leaf261]KQO63553.1 hypothetical protein ASF23_04760 [Curtobacterium sp. Leaf261]
MTKDINVQAQQQLGGIIEARDFDRFGEVWADDVVDHDPAPDQAPGIEGIVSFWKGFLAAFPDLALEPQILTADDEAVSVVFRITGTHSGDSRATPPPVAPSTSAASRSPSSATARSSSAGDRRTRRASPSSSGWAATTPTSSAPDPHTQRLIRTRSAHTNRSEQRSEP